MFKNVLGVCAIVALMFFAMSLLLNVLVRVGVPGS